MNKVLYFSLLHFFYFCSDNLNVSADILFTYQVGDDIKYTDDKQIIYPVPNTTIYPGNKSSSVVIKAHNAGHVTLGVNSSSSELEEWGLKKTVQCDENLGGRVFVCVQTRACVEPYAQIIKRKQETAVCVCFFLKVQQFHEQQFLPKIKLTKLKIRVYTSILYCTVQ